VFARVHDQTRSANESQAKLRYQDRLHTHTQRLRRLHTHSDFVACSRYLPPNLTLGCVRKCTMGRGDQVLVGLHERDFPEPVEGLVRIHRGYSANASFAYLSGPLQSWTQGAVRMWVSARPICGELEPPEQNRFAVEARDLHIQQPSAAGPADQARLASAEVSTFLSITFCRTAACFRAWCAANVTHT